MEGLGSVVFLLVMGVVWLLSQYVQHRGKPGSRVQKPAQTADEEQSERDVADAPREVVRASRMGPRFASRAERMPGMLRADSESATRTTARHLVTGRENLRRAVIVMTVLGPPVSERPRSAPPVSVPE
jgi:hypothetical protein